MAVSYTEITEQDLKDPKLSTLNWLIKSIVTELSRLAGETGEISILADINMNGHRIISLGPSQSGTDALTKSVADKSYGGPVIKQAMEATGNQVLQTARRLNDQEQREMYSTFLNNTASTPPVSNGSLITSTAAGANSNVVVTASTLLFADGTVKPYSQRNDTFANPMVGSNFYYYYVRVKDVTLQYTGPFTANTPENIMTANLDGRAFVGTAEVTAAGGGPAGGGGDTSGGCTEVGTKLTFFPGAKPNIEIQECNKWINLRLKNGMMARVDPDTLVSCFIKARHIAQGTLVEFGEQGGFSPLELASMEHLQSMKQKVTEPVHGTYLGNGIRFHNNKPAPG